MKKILVIGAFLTLLLAAAEAKSQPATGGRFGVFYSSLSGYGEWVDCNFGYAWRPRHVAAHWRPYMMGRWVWTDYGWYWSSYEPFGWATYHYGRWIYDDYYGWIWVPDDVWGPSWVEWRYDDDYIGWSPLPPYATFSVNIGISFTRTWDAPVYYWNFVPYRNFTSARVNEYVQPVERSRRIFGSTRGAVNIRGDASRVINRGVDVDIVRRRGHVEVDRTDVIHTERSTGDRFLRSGGRDKIEVYRPRLDGGATEPDRVTPRRDGNRSGAFDQPQHRNTQEEPQVRSQRDAKPEVQQPAEPRDQRRYQRDEPRVRSQRDVKPEAQPPQEPKDQRRMQRDEQRQSGVRSEPLQKGGVRSEPMPQTRERIAQPQQRVSPPSGRSQERRGEQAKPRSRGRRPF